MKKKTKALLNQIVESIQDKKGKNITVVDLTDIEDTITDYFVICQGVTPNQNSSIAHEVRDEVKKNLGDSPLSMDGIRNAEWIAIDFVNVVVHVFLPEMREFYSLETLWADAQLETVPDIE